MGKLDKLDFLILEYFQQDGKCTYSQIARKLGVSEGTVRKRATKMRKDGVFDFMIRINPVKVGYSVKAFIGIHSQLGKQHEIGQWLKTFPQVIYIASYSGYHDLILQAYFENNEALVHFVNTELTPENGIEGIDVSIQLKQYKDSISYLLS
ncbi:Lrp/AsnC family transcriptional regulator [Shouchella clausii]|uniref:Lrp/AsnC family transcriptional regulator n=3 Tax=Shouchella TaxID=2893057 RepID=Q5WDD1_SHOC1|nr:MULTISPECIES: Lrp/AsnC family transcriptional regulator [Shouchella]MCM3313498.1 Lrp/AsnC family transcriptional regulator [Psychrobacillus sp. MER TA 17]ALA54027.1 Transcriptional regulator, AsnC family [Shouchella clausii]KKI87515.1 transcriptional regulator [Shouchella clausii]MBU3229417.1 Lrp/AsnC family transcriptional regulator [Shouchella clausii]MBU3265360.1 Lrp/AsnC family transcriptional regulator [Shouchella clausii]